MEIPDEFVIQTATGKFFRDDTGLEIADAFGQERG
jgi:hypothetical protein